MKNIIPKCVCINDLAGLGRCSLTSVLAILPSMGIQACPVPTAILSTQTDGFSNYTFNDFSDFMLPYVNHWKSLNIEFDAVFSGYLGSVEQIEIVKYIIKTFKSLVVIDPVLGDDGKLYDGFTEENIIGMKDLICNANIITPNLTEFCLLTDLKYSKDLKLEEIQRAVLKLDVDNVIITSCFLDGNINTLIFSKDEEFKMIQTEYIDKSYPGTGDAFTSVLVGGLLSKLSIYDAVEQAIDFVYKAIKYSSEIEYDRAEGVQLEAVLKEYNFIN